MSQWLKLMGFCPHFLCIDIQKRYLPIDGKVAMVIVFILCHECCEMGDYRISSNSFRGIYSFQVLPAAATKRGRLLNEGGYY